MEAFLHLIWQTKQYSALTPVGSIAGQSIEVIDPGVLNMDAGADFFNAKVKIGGILWAGNVEIHTTASEWQRHSHYTDPAYNSVILHVVEHYDAEVFDSSGRSVPTAVLAVPESLHSKAKSLMAEHNPIACAHLLPTLPSEFVHHWLAQLLEQRLQDKLRRMHLLWQGLSKSWDEALYHSVLYYLGHGINGEVMIRLAQRLPLKYLLWHRDNPLQVEALLIGTAGLMACLSQGERRTLMEREYQFLSHKYRLQPLEQKDWKRARMRPASLPERRLLQMAQLVCNQLWSIQALLEADGIEALRKLFGRYAVGGSEAELSPQIVDGLIINVAIPLRLLAAGELQRSELQADTYRLLKDLPLEYNKVTRLYGRLGMPMCHAADGQALLHLYKHYCQRRSCMYCPAGRLHLGIQVGDVCFGSAAQAQHELLHLDA